MMTKTSELKGAALDWAVAKCSIEGTFADFVLAGYAFHPSTNWAQGGPIIERELCELVKCSTHDTANSGAKDWWECYAGIEGFKGHAFAIGPTPLIAAMRCYVASKLGDEVDVPTELL